MPGGNLYRTYVIRSYKEKISHASFGKTHIIEPSRISSSKNENIIILPSGGGDQFNDENHHRSKPNKVSDYDTD